MRRSILFPKSILLVGIPLLILATVFIISKVSIADQKSNALSIGITVDLLITLPVAYFLIVRKTKVPNITVVPILVLGLTVGSLILPEEDQTYLDLFKTWILPILELGVLSYVIYKVNTVRKRIKTLNTRGADFYTSLVQVCRELFPRKLVYPVVTEISVFYYGFVRWKKAPLNRNEFTYHKESGTVALLIALLLMISVETFVIHLLLEQWSKLAAWVLSALSIYSGLQIFGFMKSLFFRPYLVEKGKIYLRYGIMSETTIDIDQVESIELTSKDLGEGIQQLSLFGRLESHNLILHLKKEYEIHQLYGMHKTYSKLAIHIDDPEQFMLVINENE